MSVVSLTSHSARAVALLTERQRAIVDEHLRDVDHGYGPLTLGDLVNLFEDRAAESADLEPALSREFEAIASDLIPSKEA